MRETNEALDSLFGPYDFLDAGLAGTADIPQPPGSERMSESPEDRSPNGDLPLKSMSPDDGLPNLDFEGRAPPPPPPEDVFKGAPKSAEEMSSGSSQAAAPAPKRGRGAAPAAPAPSAADIQDKADRCRARNREHARQTRRRKKEFVENLQASVTNLTRENEAMAARLRELDAKDARRGQRVATVQALLHLRVSPLAPASDPEQELRTWSELVERDFELRLPHTPYRSFAPYEQTVSGRTVTGVAAAVADVRSLQTCFAALMRRPADQEAEARFQPQVPEPEPEPEEAPPADTGERATRASAKEAEAAAEAKAAAAAAAAAARELARREIPDGGRAECQLERGAIAWAADGTLLAPWVLRVANAEGVCVLMQRGSVKATFRRAAERGGRDKVLGLEFMFDTIGMWQQLTRASRTVVAEPYTAVPNTIEEAVCPSEEARVVTSAERPFVIEHVNEAWCRLCGFSREEALGKTLGMLQGPETDRDDVGAVVAACERKYATSALLTNYAKDGSTFQNFLRVFPLTQGGDQEVSHMLGVLQNVVG